MTHRFGTGYGIFLGYGTASTNAAFMLGIEIFSQYGASLTWVISNPVNVWHHLLATYENNLVKIYVDGEYYTQGTFSLNTLTEDKNLFLGCSDNQR